MNERIRELSDQAHHSTADDLAHLQRVHNRTYDLNESAAIYKEKFAELIVKECMKLNSKELSITAIERLLPLYEEHFGIEL